MTAPAAHGYPMKQSQGSRLGVPPAAIGSAAENSHRASAQRTLDGAAQPLFRVIPRSGCADEKKRISNDAGADLRLEISALERIEYEGIPALLVGKRVGFRFHFGQPAANAFLSCAAGYEQAFRRSLQRARGNASRNRATVPCRAATQSLLQHVARERCHSRLRL